MQGAIDGKEIEYKYNGNWEKADKPAWNWSYDYRIKPEPMEFLVDVWEARAGHMTNKYISRSGDKPEFNREYDEIKKIKTIKVKEVIE